MTPRNATIIAHSWPRRSVATVAAIACLLALSQSVAAKGEAGGTAALLPGGNSKEPVNIEADKLEFYNKEQKAIYIGNVVVVQGETSMKCTKLTIFINRQDKKDPNKPKPAEPQPVGGAPGNDSVRRMDADGPVTLVSKDQVGTGDHLAYDKPLNKVTISGHVVLTQGENVTKGDTLTYDLATGVARVDSGGTAGRVSGYFVPGSSGAKLSKQDDAAPSEKPAKKGRGAGRTASRQKRTD